MRLRLSTINHRLLTCQPTARVYGLLDRVGDALGRNPIIAFDGAKLDGVISRTIIGGRP